jgi:hypothetical protein
VRRQREDREKRERTRQQTNQKGRIEGKRKKNKKEERSLLFRMCWLPALSTPLGIWSDGDHPSVVRLDVVHIELERVPEGLLHEFHKIVDALEYPKRIANHVVGFRLKTSSTGRRVRVHFLRREWTIAGGERKEGRKEGGPQSLREVHRGQERRAVRSRDTCTWRPPNGSTLPECATQTPPPRSPCRSEYSRRSACHHPTWWMA